MHAKLVGVPGSHPCVSAELMLRYKGVEFTRLDLPNMTHKALLPLLRYRGSTVPVISFEGKRISAHFFTQLVPSSTYPLRSQLRQLVYQALVD